MRLKNQSYMNSNRAIGKEDCKWQMFNIWEQEEEKRL